MEKQKKRLVRVVLAGFVLACAFRSGSAQSKPQSYPVAAPLTEYFIADRTSEI